MNIIPLGTYIKPYGEIGMVGSISGERYYWFVDKKDDAVAMMPASVIEPMYWNE